jgi:hypothetical protein
MVIKSANGATGCLLRVGFSEWVFRVHSDDGTFKDYDFYHSDMQVTICDDDATFYEDGDNLKLDHSPETLGFDK